MTHTYFAPFLMYLYLKQTCCFSHTFLTYCILKESFSCMCSLSWVSHYVSWLPGQPNLISLHVGEQKILGDSFLLHPLNPRGAVFHNCLPDTHHQSPCQSCLYRHPSWSDPSEISIADVSACPRLRSSLQEMHDRRPVAVEGGLNGQGTIFQGLPAPEIHPTRVTAPEWGPEHPTYPRNESSVPACRHSHSFECYFETLSILPLSIESRECGLILSIPGSPQS